MELLVVIVVIGILATISIVVYTGVQARARAAATDLEVSTIKKAYKIYSAEGNGYPTSSSEDEWLSELSHKIVWGGSDDPGFGAATTTHKGEYFVFMSQPVLAIYFWDYKEGAWRHIVEYENGGSWNDYATLNSAGAYGDRCSLDILENCGQQGEY